MSEFESLLSTLAERERLLRDLQAEVGRAQTLSHAMDRIYGCVDLERGIREALDLCQKAIGADLWLLLRRSEGVVTTLAISEAGHPELTWNDPQDRLSSFRRVADVREVPSFDALPMHLKGYLSQLSIPIAAPSEPYMTIMWLSRERADFSSSDQSLSRSIGRLIEQVTGLQSLAHRNSILARVLDSSSDTSPSPAGFRDISFDALSNVYSRMTDWQGRVVEITNELLSTSPEKVHTAIENILAQTGKLANADRTYVFRLREPDRLDNTHEWVAPGIVPMIAELQDLPDSMLDDWRSELLAGNAVHIPDIEDLPEASCVKGVLQMQKIRSLLVVPMLRNGCLTGFVGYDAVCSHRQYLPTEITMLKSVANAVNVMLDRAAAEAEAKVAQTELVAERNRLKATLAAIPDLIIESDGEGRFVNHVPGVGLQPAVATSEFIGRCPEDVLPADVATIIRHAMAIVDREGQTEGHEYKLAVDGDRRVYQLSASAKLNEGFPAGYVFAIRDITERASERQQLQRLSMIAELTSNLVVITDKDQQIEWVNPAFERRTGWRLDEVRGSRPERFLATERTDRAEMRQIGQALRAKQPIRAELLNRSRTGQDYWISKDIQPILNSDENVTGFVAVQTEITQLKQSHQRTQQDYLATLDGSNDGIAMTDAEGYYIYMNPVHRRMFGISEAEDVHLLNWQDLYLPETVERYMVEEWDSLQATGQWRGEMVGRHRDGSNIVQEVSLSLRGDGILCITRDISERLRLEAERSRLREQLQVAQRRETVAHLAAEVGHDLNNLVAVVAGSAALVKDSVKEHSEARAAVKRILRATDAAKDIVSGLSEIGHTKKKPDWQDLCELIEEGVNLLDQRLAKKCKISIDLPEFPCLVWADHSELLQVIINLTINACDAGMGQPNRVRLAVIPDATIPERSPDAGIIHPDKDYKVFSVSDQGKGINADMQAHLFDRNFSTKKQPGSGLGLSIVARILNSNNAALWLESTLAEGTTMTVAWPSQCPDTDSHPQICSTDTSGSDLTGCYILVVDDMPDVADVLSEMIETSGAMGVAVPDSAEALELLRDNPGLWSALVTDYNMPAVSGADLARTASACSPPVPAILVTALAEAVGPNAALFHKVLSKPIDAAELIAAVHAVVPRTGDKNPLN